jgi:uncharacterized membrane protein YidH (DUF202 family)
VSHRTGGGLPVERTALAWNRSAIGVAAIGAVVVRIGAVGGHTAAALVAGGVLAGLALGVWASGHRLYRGRRDGVAPSHQQQRQALLLITASSVACAAVAFAFATTS